MGLLSRWERFSPGGMVFTTVGLGHRRMHRRTFILPYAFLLKGQFASRSSNDPQLALRLRTHFVTRILIGCMWLKAGVGTALGQIPTAAIHGSVTGPSGGVVVSAEVTVRQIGTGLIRKVTTTAEGAFRIEALEPGTYEIGVSNPGFETTRRELTLLVGDSRTVNLELKVEGATQRIDVKTEVSGVN